jgi:YHS domain-containing protein
MISRVLGITLALLVLAPCTRAADKAPDPREALRAFQDLIGSWRGTGEPEGTREEKQKGFWIETIRWEWQFKGNDAWLVARFEKGKYFTHAELHPLPEKDRFRLVAVTSGTEKLTFEGKLADGRLTVEREEPKSGEMQRLVFSFPNDKRFLYAFEVRDKDRTTFTRKYRVGATREGVAFAGPGDNTPECIVSGGKGTMPVTYQGKTYYVCCSGCRDAFKDDPEKYIKEYEEKKAKERKEK